MPPNWLGIRERSLLLQRWMAEGVVAGGPLVSYGVSLDVLLGLHTAYFQQS